MSPNPKRRNRFRFPITNLLLLMFVVAIAATGARYMVRSMQSADGIAGKHDRFMFILFVLAAPALVLVALSVTMSIIRRKR